MTRRIAGAAVVVVTAIALIAGLQGQVPQDPGSWISASPMAGVREGASSVLLSDGRVLVLGGRNADGAISSAEIYSNGSWSEVPSPIERSGQTATLLADGRVLIAGGEDAAGLSALLDIFNPADNSLIPAGTLSSARKGHAATLLQDGRVLIAGGFNGQGVVSSVEIFDPASGSIAAAPFSLSTARAGLSATTLLDGRVLLAGGNDGTNDVARAEVVNVSTWSVSTRTMSTARRDHSAVLLPNNNAVLIAGGVSGADVLASAEVYLPWVDQFRATGSMAQARHLATSSALSRESYGALSSRDGRALAAGGSETPDSELFRFAVIKTDKDDYWPGQKVFVSGSGWEPGEEITLALREVPAEHSSRTFALIADASGRIVGEFLFDVEDHHFGVRFYLTAKQTLPGVERQAQTTFTDGNATITGTVKNSSTGNPIAGATVTCSVANGCNNAVSATTDSTGAYTLNVNFPGSSAVITLVASASDFSSVSTSIPASNNHTLNFSLTPSTVSTATSIASSQNPSVYGLSVTFTATVTASASNPNDVGTVTFKNGTTVICSAVPLSGNSATCSTAALSVVGSPHSITAEYSGTTTGSPQFQASTSSALSQVVNKADQATLSVDAPLSGGYGDKLTMTASGGSGTGAVSFAVVSGSTGCSIVASGDHAGKLEITNGSGTCSITATKAADDNYKEATSAAHAVAIAKAAGSVTINNVPSTATFGGSFTPTFTTAGDGVASVASLTTGTCTVNSGVVNFVAAGTCTLQASLAEGPNHLEATGAEQGFTIAKAAGSVTINNVPSTATFGGSFTPTFTTAGDGVASVASLTTGTCTVNSGVVNFVGAGTCTLQASVAEGPNHLEATGAEQGFTIARATPSVSVTWVGGIYTGNPWPASGSVTGVGTPPANLGLPSFAYYSGSTVTGTPLAGAPVNAGTYTVRASFAMNSNYNAAYADATIIITKAPATVTLSNLSHVFDGTPKAPTVTTDPAGLAVALTYNGSTAAPSAVGTYSVVGTIYDANYQGSTSNTLTIAAWYATGFYQPVGIPNSVFLTAPGMLPAANGSTAWNTAKGGSTIPLKFNIYTSEGGVERTSTADILNFQAVKLAGCTTAPEDAIDEFATTGSTSLRYDTTERQFIQNWKTPNVSKEECYRVNVRFQDNSTIYAFVKLRK